MRRTPLAIAVLFLLSAINTASAETIPADRLLLSQLRLSSRLIDRLSIQQPETSNIVISPAGILSALSLLDVGADTQMRAALLNTAGLSFGPGSEATDDFTGVCQTLSGGFKTTTAKEATFDFGNAVIFDPAIKPDHAAIAELEKAGAKVLTSSINDARAIDEVNRWILKKTRGLIPELIDHASRKSGFLIADALYFKGRWSTPFRREDTHRQIFHGVGGDLEVPMMTATRRESIRASEHFAGVDLAYGNGRFRMVLVTTTDQSLGADGFRRVSDWLSGQGFERTEVLLSLPRFKLQQTADLFEALAGMGLKQGLKSLTAFQGFSAAPQTISGITQNTYLGVDEESTEAASVTALPVEVTAAQMPVAVTIDRPFIFGLRDTSTGLLIMSGYVARPAGGQSANRSSSPPAGVKSIRSKTR
jgi:serine protease inhibitor